MELPVNGGAAEAGRLSEPGEHELSWPVEEDTKTRITEFTVSHATTPNERDHRELSLVVSSVVFSKKSTVGA